MEDKVKNISCLLPTCDCAVCDTTDAQMEVDENSPPVGEKVADTADAQMEVDEDSPPVGERKPPVNRKVIPIFRSF